MITQAKLKKLLHYDPETGVFTWKVNVTKKRAGDVAGCRSDHGYWTISIRNCPYRAHRLAWLYMIGEWPQFEIDHKNGIKSDNRWKNLREATRVINAQNRRSANAGSKTGILGVSPHGSGFRATITTTQKRRHLGTYPTPELAHAAYIKAKRELHEGCTI